MPTTTKALPQMPSDQQPVIDPRTGKLDPRWLEYFQALDRCLRTLRTEIP